MNGFDHLFGETAGSFAVLTLLIGVCAIMTGQSVARVWRPFWQILPAALLLAGAERFLSYALFHGNLLSGIAFLRDWVILGALAAFAYRAMRSRQMATQYPWIYRRVGWFGWRMLSGARDENGTP